MNPFPKVVKTRPLRFNRSRTAGEGRPWGRGRAAWGHPETLLERLCAEDARVSQGGRKEAPTPQDARSQEPSQAIVGSALTAVLLLRGVRPVRQHPPTIKVMRFTPSFL